MNAATVLALLQAAESVAMQAAQLIAGAKLAGQLLTEGRAPTAEEQASIDAALELSHTALQAAQPAG